MSQVGFLFYSEVDETYEVECPVCGEYNMVDSDDVHKILNKKMNPFSSIVSYL